MELKFSKILSNRLKGKNLSALAKKLGMPRSILHSWVKAEGIPSLNNLDYIIKLADYLNLSLEEILTGEEGNRKVISAITFQDESRVYKMSIERIK